MQVPLPEEAQADERDDAGLAPAATRSTLFGRYGRGRADGAAEHPGRGGDDDTVPPLQFWPPPLPIPASLEDDAAVPTAFRCPITYEIMREPAVALSGQTYERDAITRWLSGAQPHVDPITKAPLSVSHLSPNLALRAVMQDWLRERQGEIARWQWLQVTPSCACDCCRDGGADGDGPAGGRGDVRGEGLGGGRCGQLCPGEWVRHLQGGSVLGRSVPESVALGQHIRRMRVSAAADPAPCERTRSAPAGGGGQSAARPPCAAVRRQPSAATRRRTQSAGAAELQRRTQLVGLAEDGCVIDDTDVDRLFSRGAAGPSGGAQWLGGSPSHTEAPSSSGRSDAGAGVARPLPSAVSPCRDAWCACMQSDCPGASPAAASPRHACRRSCWGHVTCGCCGRIGSSGGRSTRSASSAEATAGRTRYSLTDCGAPWAAARGSDACMHGTANVCPVHGVHACASPVNSQYSSLPSSPDVQARAAAALARSAWPALDPDSVVDQSASSGGLMR